MVETVENDDPPSKLRISRLPLPRNSISALSFTSCFATDFAALPASRMRTIRGFLTISVRYSRIRYGIYFEIPRETTCPSDGDPNTSFLLQRRYVRFRSVKENPDAWENQDWHYIIIWARKSLSAFIIVSGAEADIKSSWKWDEKKGACVPWIVCTFADSIQGCAGKPYREIKHYWPLVRVTDYLRPFVAHLWEFYVIDGCWEYLNDFDAYRLSAILEYW